MLARFLKWAFRPAVLVAVSIALVGAARSSSSRPSKVRQAATLCGAPRRAGNRLPLPATNNTPGSASSRWSARTSLCETVPGLRSSTTLPLPSRSSRVVLRCPQRAAGLPLVQLTSDWSPRRGRCLLPPALPGDHRRQQQLLGVSWPATRPRRRSAPEADRPLSC